MLLPEDTLISPLLAQEEKARMWLSHSHRKVDANSSFAREEKIDEKPPLLQTVRFTQFLFA
jgi:hypothetical protein